MQSLETQTTVQQKETRSHLCKRVIARLDLCDVQTINDTSGVKIKQTTTKLKNKY